MSNTGNIKIEDFYKLFIFSFSLALLTYGFALTNYTLSIDNEIPILSNFGLDLGRWGQNLIRYHLFNGHLQYFSFVLSLFLFSISAAKIAKLFKFEGILAYFFCGLFITFPQLSYQVVFSMMADVAGFGVLLSVCSVELFITGCETKSKIKKVLSFLFVALIVMFALSIYQILILIPVTLYLILFFQKTFYPNFELKLELKKVFVFGGLMIVSVLLYYISVKIICPIQNGSYLSSYTSGNSDHTFLNFITLLKENLLGSAYYGEKLYFIVWILILILTIKYILNKKYFIYRFLFLVFLLISPFLISYFITNGYHPPRLYLTSNIVFAFIIVFALKEFKLTSHSITKIAVSLFLITNIYFITNLFFSVNRIYKHDKKTAEKIDYTIQNKYPQFSSSQKMVYFYGYFPYEYHQKFRLQNDEIFGGSYYNWDNGNNYRLNKFFEVADVAEYKMIETKEQYNSIKDSIEKMPVWPDYESVKMINNIIIVKLGKDKGMPISVE